MRCNDIWPSCKSQEKVWAPPASTKVFQQLASQHTVWERLLLRPRFDLGILI